VLSKSKKIKSAIISVLNAIFSMIINNNHYYFCRFVLLLQIWQYQSQYRCQSPVTAIATTKLAIVTTLPPPSYVIIALADSSVHCLNRLDCLKEVAFSSLNMCWRQDEPSNKYLKNSVSIAHMDLSWLGCVLLACDTRGNLYLYKLLPDGTTGIHTHTHACAHTKFLISIIILFMNYFAIYVRVFSQF